jgi:hypothetical protein
MKELILAATMIAQMSMSNPPAMTGAEIAKSASGTQLHFVLRIDQMQRTTALGHVLDPVSGNDYHVSSSVIAVHVANDLPVVMGSHDDLKPGAVVFVYGVATKAKAADATKLVVITPYVKTQ